MSVAKRLLAKLARLYRRLKLRPIAKKVTDKKKCITKCHKGCGTLSDDMELNELDNIASAGDGRKNTAAGRTSAKQPVIVNTKADIAPEPSSPPTASHTIFTKRIAAGNEDSADAATQADVGPILETGISKRAFCRQLDNLLQRSLGTDCARSRLWTTSDSTFC